jgi:undecaprenyl-diphosphatase
MTPVQAVSFGVVQGLTEFLPVSSSAHLVLLPWLAGWPDPGLAFDVALHLGTLAALLVYFWRDWLKLAREALSSPRDSLLLKLAWGTLPAAIVGVAFKHWIETVLRAPWIAGMLLAVFGLLLGAGEWYGSRRRDEASVGWGEALLIGAAQALALMPGVSRSGVTMTAALFLGLSSEGAARFSFLLATPAMFGAGLLEGRHIAGSAVGAPFYLAVLSSAIVGTAVIGALLSYLRRRSLMPFVVYRVVAGLTIMALWFAGVRH